MLVRTSSPDTRFRALFHALKMQPWHRGCTHFGEGGLLDIPELPGLLCSRIFFFFASLLIGDRLLCKRPEHKGQNAAAGDDCARARKTRPTFSFFPAFTTRCQRKGNDAAPLGSRWGCGATSPASPPPRPPPPRAGPSLRLGGPGCALSGCRAPEKNQRLGTLGVQWALKCN